MDILIVVLLVAIIVILLRRERKADVPAAAKPAPAAQSPLTQELHNRMETFLEQDLFSLVIQPVVDYRTNRISNGEVLSRLNHPERGVIFPTEFLPVVDELGLYPRFDRYIFRKSCVWLSRSLAQGEQFDCLSCNFSRKTLSQKGLAQDLIEIADSYHLPLHKLAVEITEMEQETDSRILFDNLKQLKNAGFRIILDDFGEGVTSAKDLKYPLDILKIDRSMLLDTHTEQGRKAIGAVIAMARELGVEVVCEGIETTEQDHFARTIGFDYGQGFLYFRPVSHAQVFEMISQSSIHEDHL